MKLFGKNIKSSDIRDFIFVILMVIILIIAWRFTVEKDNSNELSTDFEIVEAVDSYVENGEVVIIYKAYEKETEKVYYITSNNTVLINYTEDVEEK